MVFKTIILVGILFLIHSCAQVNSLTGGEKDTVAPKPIERKMVPQNGSTNMVTSEIKIPFDEFFKLENPLESIVIVPADATISARVDKKTLFLSWKETLKSNTTYSIYLNGTVQDITEGNDSLIHYVFSTGDKIDSLGFQIKVIDAFTNQPIKNALVGLYEGKTDSIKPTYFVKTSPLGLAKFTNLKNGDFSIVAIDDKNKDMLLQASERVAFRDKKITILPEFVDSNLVLVDSIPLRLFAPKLPPRIRTLEFKPPGMFVVGATRSLKNTQFLVNQKKLESSDYQFITEDSIAFFYLIGDSSNLEFIATSEEFTDTASIRLTKKDKLKPLTFVTNLKDNFLYPSDSLTISLTDCIKSVKLDGFQLINKLDSTPIPLKNVSFDRNKLVVLFDKGKIKSAELRIAPNSIQTAISQFKDSINLKFQLNETKDFGVIKLDASEYNEPITVEVISNQKVIRTISLDSQKIVSIEQLLPADYSFRIILDQNKNGKWDTGDRLNNLFPEMIHTFSDPITVRANWDIDVKLAKKY